MDASTHEQLAELIRAELAAGSSEDEMLLLLRHRELEKVDCIGIMQAATGMSHCAAKLLVHNSPVWADRREIDEYVEDTFWRALFVEALVSGGRIDAPPEWAVDCRERQRRANALLHEVSRRIPPDILSPYREFIGKGHLGRAFAALVVAGTREDMPVDYWRALAAVADTLCINELLDGDVPGVDNDDYIYAAYVVRRLSSAPD